MASHATTVSGKTPKDLATAAIDQLEPCTERIELGRSRQRAVWRGDTDIELPILLQGRADPPVTKDPYPWRRFDHSEQFHDADKMLAEAVWALLDGQNDPDARGDSLLVVRANFGTVVTATTFGVEALPLPHTPPWISEHLTRAETKAAIERLDLDKAPLRGLAAVSLERTAYFLDRLVGKALVFDVNNQSPLDIAHQVRGEDIFYDMYDDPPFVHDLLEACTRAYIAVARAFKKVLDMPDDCSYSGSIYREGCGVHAADDTATVLGPDLFAEFALPYDCRAFAAFGGGSIHFCGSADHIIDGYLQAPEVRAINFGQPELYNHAEAADKVAAAGKIYFGSWPVLEGESLDSYLQRVIGPAGAERRPQILGLRGHEFGVPPEQIAQRWYEYQRER